MINDNLNIMNYYLHINRLDIDIHYSTKFNKKFIKGD